MYILEVRNKGQVGRNKNSNILSFEDFDFLLREKEKYEVNGNICFVYKVSNDGREIKRLSEKSSYVNVVDLEKEQKKSWRQYVRIRDKLVKGGYRNFYVKNNVLYICDNGNVFEVEMVRKTPRYEVRFNGKLVSDSETSQNDIIEKLFCRRNGKVGNVLLSRVRREGCEVRYK